MKSLLIKILLLLLLSSTCAAQIKMQLKTTQTGIALIEYYEGIKLKSYRCSANILTIGIGHTGTDVFENQVITKSEAILILKKDLNRFEKYVNTTTERLIKWYEFDALVSFTFNLGYRIDQIMKEAIDRGNTKIVVIKILKYNKARVKGSLVVLNGLTKRRKAEAALYQNKISSSLALAIR